ncbi:MAG: hypothetical protein HY791_35025 [Deltaproteobacteria bacterium]|nr:hypothetical protein [Deltaproteobacteria bacterium]
MGGAALASVSSWADDGLDVRVGVVWIVSALVSGPRALLGSLALLCLPGIAMGKCPPHEELFRSATDARLEAHERGYAIWCLAASPELRTDSRVRALIRSALENTEAPVREAAAQAAGLIPNEWPRIVPLFEDPDPRVRAAAVSTVLGVGGAEDQARARAAIASVERALGAKHAKDRARAVESWSALVTYECAPVGPLLSRLASESASSVQRAMVGALAERLSRGGLEAPGRNEIGAALVKTLSAADARVRIASARGLQFLAWPASPDRRDSVTPWIDALSAAAKSDRDQRVRKAACTSLAVFERLRRSVSTATTSEPSSGEGACPRE